MINHADMARIAAKLDTLADKFESIAVETTAGDYTAGLAKGVQDGLWISESIIRSTLEVGDKGDLVRLEDSIRITASWVSPFQDEPSDFACGFEEGRPLGAQIAVSMLSLVFLTWETGE